MKSNFVRPGQTGASQQYDALRDDARAASALLAHQQQGTLALPTNPSNGQAVTLTINSTPITVTFVTAIGSAPGNVLIGATAAATALNLLNLLQNPQVTSSTQVALSVANQTLCSYLGYALNGTTVTVFSLNNSANPQLTSFSASTTVTGASWTANTMALYIEPGICYISSTRVIFAGGNTPTFTAPSANPRIDIVTLDSSGTLAITQGTENTSPVAPSYPVNKITICEVYNVVGETAIFDNANQQASQGYILNDVRPTLIATPAAQSLLTVGLDANKPSSPVVGQVYVATDTLTFYECFTAGTWKALLKTASVASGTDAAKPASPSVGDVYVATDTGILYVCFIAGTFQAYGSAAEQKQVFTSSGTFTVPSGVTTVYVTMIGGGASGGSAGSNTAHSAGSGSSGQYCIKFPVTVTPGANVTVTVGTGGAQQATASTNGNPGTATSFGSVSMAGGIGGGAGTSTSNGSGGSTTQPSIPGSAGFSNTGSIGANSPMGVGGPAGNFGDGGAATGYGAGGGGGGDHPGSAKGGAGSPGICIVEW